MTDNRKTQEIQMKTVFSFAAIFCAFCLLAGNDDQEKTGAVRLVDNGKPAAAVILPDAPQPACKLAAEELVMHIRKASGAELPVYPESQVPFDVKTRVWLGPCKKTAEAGIECAELPPSGWVIRGRGNGIRALADAIKQQRGVLHAELTMSTTGEKIIS